MAPHFRETTYRDDLSDVGAILAATSHRDILRLTVDRIQRFGLSFVTVWSPRPDGVPMGQSLDLNTRPTLFVERYIRDELFLRDPILLAMHRTLKTLTWSEVMRLQWPRSGRAIVEGARDFGANDGLTMPIFSRRMLAGVFSVCGRDPDLSPDARNALKALGLAVHQALMRISIEDARRPQHVMLTPREREVIHWVMRGKSNSEIGDILRVGVSTVKTLLSRSQDKLGASNRTGAVVQALRLGELHLDA